LQHADRLKSVANHVCLKSDLLQQLCHPPLSNRIVLYQQYPQEITRTLFLNGKAS
jgi:hypothetical protein